MLNSFCSLKGQRCLLRKLEPRCMMHDGSVSVPTPTALLILKLTQHVQNMKAVSEETLTAL